MSFRREIDFNCIVIIVSYHLSPSDVTFLPILQVDRNELWTFNFCHYVHIPAIWELTLWVFYYIKASLIFPEYLLTFFNVRFKEIIRTERETDRMLMVFKQCCYCLQVTGYLVQRYVLLSADFTVVGLQKFYIYMWLLIENREYCVTVHLDLGFYYFFFFLIS